MRLDERGGEESEEGYDDSERIEDIVELGQIITIAESVLTEHEQLVVACFTYEMPGVLIEERTGVCYARAHRIQKRALRKIRKALHPILARSRKRKLNELKALGGRLV